MGCARVPPCIVPGTLGPSGVPSKIPTHVSVCPGASVSSVAILTKGAPATVPPRRVNRHDRRPPVKATDPRSNVEARAADMLTVPLPWPQQASVHTRPRWRPVHQEVLQQPGAATAPLHLPPRDGVDHEAACQAVRRGRAELGKEGAGLHGPNRRSGVHRSRGKLHGSSGGRHGRPLLEGAGGRTSGSPRLGQTSSPERATPPRRALIPRCRPRLARLGPTTSARSS